VESGKLMADSLSLMLVRKHDWHDGDGVAYLLEHGADPNHGRRRGLLPLHHAIARDNAIEILDLLLDHGADSSRVQEGMTAVVRAAHHGRGDLLASLERRGIPIALAGVDRLIAACARQDAAEARALAQREPLLAREIVAGGGTLMARFAGVGNTGGIRLLLELGVPVTAASPEGDGYWNVAKDSQALHVAAWRARHATVRLLLEGGAPVDAPDGQGRTPLMLAVIACVDAYWSDRRTNDSVAALLTAGASVRGVRYPSGYAEADALLAQAGAR
jgi:ankyrin repeat protein